MKIFFVQNKQCRIDETVERWSRQYCTGTILLNYNDTIPLNEHKEMAEKIREHYLGSKNIDGSTAMQLIHMVSDEKSIMDLLFFVQI